MLEHTKIPALIAMCGLCGAPAVALGQEGAPSSTQQPAQPRVSQPTATQPESAQTEAVEQAESPEAAEARRVLENAVETLEATESLFLRATYRAEGAFAEMFPQMDATVVAWRNPVAAPPGSFDDGKPNSWDIRVTGTGKRAANAESSEFEAIRRDWNTRASWEWLDEEAQQLVRRRDAGARGTEIRLARELLHLEAFNAFPYRRIMRTGSLSMGEPGTLNGVQTTVVRHDPEQGARYTLYHFGAEDRLLRRVEERFSAPGGLDGKLILDYSDVRANVPVAGTTREFDVPDGFSEVGMRPDLRRLGMQNAPVEPMIDNDPTRPIVVRRAGLPFSLETTGGETVTNETLHGNVTVMGFWATWAPGTDDAGRDIQAMLNDYAELPVAYVGPLVRERRPEKAVEWMAENGYDWPLLKGADTLAREYGVRKFPTYVLLGMDGEVIGTIEGYAQGKTFAEIRTTVDDYLAEKGLIEAESDDAEAGEGSMGGEG